MTRNPYRTTTLLWKMGDGKDSEMNAEIEAWLTEQLADDYVLHSITETAMAIRDSSTIARGGPPIDWVHCRITVEHISVRKDRGL